MTESYSFILKNGSANPVESANEKKQIIEDFFKIIEKARRSLNAEEIAAAIETLKLSTIELRQIQERKRLEEEAARAEEKRRKQQQAKEAAAEREAAKAEEAFQKHVREVTAMDLPMDWVNPYDGDERADEKTESIGDGLLMSLDRLAMVDIEFIASLTGSDCRSVIENLRGSIYQNPLFWNECFYKGWETADEYLSGNLMHKLKIAREANQKYNGYFDDNVRALEALVEDNIDIDGIYVTLGSPWLPTDIIDDFILHLIGEEPENGIHNEELKEYFSRSKAVRHDEHTGIWEIPDKSRFRMGRLHGHYEHVECSLYGTARMPMLHLLENILNMKTPVITDYKNPYSSARVINNGETVKLLEKQDRMIAEFQQWVWQNEDRKIRLQNAYCRKYGNIRQRHYDGSFLRFPNMSEKVELFDYQKDSVARILMSPNTLLAHDVGAGKTYVMVAAGMELRRLGKSRKNLYVVPNNILGQWQKIFLEMYPDADLLIVDNRNFNSKKRSETLIRIRDEDHDAIIMTYSCFDMLSLSRQYYQQFYQHQLEMLEKASKVFESKAKLDR